MSHLANIDAIGAPKWLNRKDFRPGGAGPGRQGLLFGELARNISLLFLLASPTLDNAPNLVVSVPLLGACVQPAYVAHLLKQIKNMNSVQGLIKGILHWHNGHKFAT